MARLSDPRGFRRLTGGVSLVAAPLVLLAGTVLHPARRTDEAEQLAVVSDHLGRWYAAHVLFLLSIALGLPGLLALMHLLRARRPALAHLGGGLALLGTVPVTAVVALDFATWQLGKREAERAAMTGLLDQMNGSRGLMAVAFASLAYPIGFAVLGVGLQLARAAPGWIAALVALSPTLFFIGGFATTTSVVVTVAAAALLAGEGALGLRVLAASDEEWERGVPG